MRSPAGFVRMRSTAGDQEAVRVNGVNITHAALAAQPSGVCKAACTVRLCSVRSVR